MMLTHFLAETVQKEQVSRRDTKDWREAISYMLFLKEFMFIRSSVAMSIFVIWSFICSRYALNAPSLQHAFSVDRRLAYAASLLSTLKSLYKLYYMHK